MQSESHALPFKIEPEEKYILIRLIGHPGLESVKPFEEQILKTLGSQPKPVIVDCQGIEELSPHWIRALTVLSQHLKSALTGLRLVDAKADIAQMIRQNGLAQALPLKPTRQSALVDLGLAPARKIDVKFINPFLVATIGVLKVQANVTSKPGQPYKCQPKDRFFGDVSGIIGLVSESFVGAVVLSFPEKTFLAIMSSMLGEKIERLNQDIIDGAGELTNIIFGQAKVVLNAEGFGIKTAIPTVVSGPNHNIQAQTPGPRVALPFESSAGPFTVEICLSE